MSPDHAGRASAPTTNPTTNPTPSIPTHLMSPSTAPLAYLPHCARGRVLEQDSLGPEPLADRIRLAEILAPAGLVPGLDRRGDVLLAEPRAGAPATSLRGEEGGGVFAEDPPDGGDACQVRTQRSDGRPVAGVDRSV